MTVSCFYALMQSVVCESFQADFRQICGFSYQADYPRSARKKMNFTPSDVPRLRVQLDDLPTHCST